MTSNTSLEEEVLASSAGQIKKTAPKDKPLKGKNIHVSEIKSIIHDMFTHWDIENSELNIDRYFTDLCDSVRDTYTTYILPKKIKKSYEDDLTEIIETEIINRIQNVEVTKTEEQIQRNIGVIDFLNTIETPAQRSEGWYAFRNNRITASDFAVA